MYKINLGIIGTSLIAEEHLKVLNKLNKFKIYGITSRTNKNSKKLAHKFSINIIYKNYIDMVKDPNIDVLLVLVSADQIYKVINDIIPYKKPFFTEKPPGLSLDQASKLVKKWKKFKTLNMVGFNRRFYSVFHKGMEYINKKGKLIGLAIEGHERFWLLKNIKKKYLLRNWIYANSSHTIDLIRFFGGEVKKINSHVNNFLSSQNNQISSSFILESGCVGSYQSHWLSPGGWSVKLYGEGVTVDFKPLEKGILINNKFKKKIIEPDKYDIMFKPGFYQQMISFQKMIEKQKKVWPAQDLSDSLKTMKLIKNIADGS